MEFNVHNLVKWFQIKYPKFVEAMKKADHHYSKEELNPYHLESDVFTHTMMVVLEASKNTDLFQVAYNDLIVAALLHDLGKPLARAENHEKKRVNFYNHEPLSAFLAVHVIDDILKDFNVPLNKRTILEAIAMHTEVFKLTEEKLTQRLINNKGLALLLSRLSKSDHHGRFYDMGDRITTDMIPEVTPVKEYEKEVIVNVGLPCSGKSTSTKTGKGWVTLSRDDIVMQLGLEQGIQSYEAAFKAVDQKEVDKIFQERKELYIKDNHNIVVDMTHMSRKSRRKTLQGFNNYKKTAHVYMASLMDIAERNEKRKGKTIPDDVIERMAKSFYPPLYDEFDEIVWRFN